MYVDTQTDSPNQIFLPLLIYLMEEFSFCFTHGCWYVGYCFEGFCLFVFLGGEENNQHKGSEILFNSYLPP